MRNKFTNLYKMGKIKTTFKFISIVFVPLLIVVFLMKNNNQLNAFTVENSGDFKLSVENK